MPAKILKERTPHGMKRVPVVLAMAEARPLFQAGTGHDYDEHYGESFYHSSRNIFEFQNFIYSIVMELSQRSIKQPLVLESRDGTFTLPDADPRVSGQEIATSTDNQEQIKPLPPMEMVREAATLLGLISSEMQRGTFPASAFGELAFQLSGFAINQLRQGLEAPLTHHIKAVAKVTKQMLDLLCDTYSDGEFDQMELSGRLQTPSRSYFQETIDPNMIKNGGTIEVEVLAVLPQDDASKVSLAQLLRDPGASGVPVADDRFIREHILSIQDVEQMERAIWTQQANRGSPMAIAWNSMIAAAEEGDQEMAKLWENEWQVQLLTKMLEMMQLQMMGQQGGMGGGPEGGGGGGGTGDQPRPRLPGSEVMPPEMMGRGSGPSGQAGPNVPPGRPRPGAQDDDTRLANIGLFGPRG